MIATNRSVSFKKSFTTYAFCSLPLSFAYHLSHNLNHLISENGNIFEVLLNPFGTNTLPLSMMEKHMRHDAMWLPQEALFAIQAILMFAGFWIALQVIVQRSVRVFNVSRLS